MMDILELQHIHKNFGNLSVLQDLNVSVPRNSVFGLIGKNGAGKTTTMKMILGFLQPTAGEIRVCGEKVTYGETRTNRFIGYLPDVPEYYGYMTPKEYLSFCGSVAGLKPTAMGKRIGELMELVGLAGANRRISGFSRGMKQRLGIAQALLNEPELLICDEPTSALDPIGRKEILDILAVVGEKTAIVFSTHVLSDVERICDRIGILHGGRLVLQGDLADIKSTYRADQLRIELEGREGAAKLAEQLRQFSFVTQSEAKENTVTLRLSSVRREGLKILDLLVREQIPVLRYEVLEPTLEDVFLEVVG